MAWPEVTVLGGVFVVLMALGVPIAYCIGLSTAAALLMALPAEATMTTVAQRMAAGLNSFALLAIPFFIVAGQLMNRGGIAARLIDFARTVLGFLPGGLAYVNTLAAMLMGAISGSAVASASAIGSIMGPRMEKAGYDRPYSAAVNIASAVTGLIIPPSNILIVYSLASGGVSIAALFVAGYVPGVLLGVGIMAVAGVVAWRRGYPREAVPRAGEVVRSFLRAVPSLLLIVIVVGGIIAGVFTATEGAAVAVAYAFVLTLAYGEMKLREIPAVLLESSVTTAVVLLLIAASSGMSWVLAFENVPQEVSAALVGLSREPVVILLLINLLLLVVGTFMDMTPAVLIFTPIFLPVVKELGVHPVHFGIVMVMNLCIGLCTPPVGSVLFVGCGVAKLPVVKVIRPLLWQFVGMTGVLMVVTYVPWVSLAVPRWLGLVK